MKGQHVEPGELAAVLGRPVALTAAEVAGARRTCARRATGLVDLADLLDMLGIGPTPSVAHHDT